MSKSLIFKALAFSLFTYSQFTVAANLYRCGNSYQDTPCKEATTKPIKNIAQPSNKAADGNQGFQKVDADCKQRGDAAKKIMWAREVGKTADQQMEDAQTGYSRALVKDVYNHRGSSLEVKNAIEQECMQQKEQDRLAEKLIIEAERLRGNRGVSVESSADSKAQLTPTLEPDQAGQRVSVVEKTPDSVEKKSKCADLKSQVEYIAGKRRTGGGASYMNDLKLRQDQLESNMRSQGC
jgi:hypothetical protein